MYEPRDFGQDRELAKQFLNEFTEVDEENQVRPKYVNLMTKLANREANHMHIQLKDLEQFNHDLSKQVTSNTLRYVDIFYQALDELLPTFTSGETRILDPMDNFIQQRLLINERNQNRPNINPLSSSQTARTVNVDIDEKYPPDLLRRAEIYFKPPNLEPIPIRQVNADEVGRLITVRGIVTRATEVKPKLTIATYTCDQCGCETFQPIYDRDFTPLSECSSSVCKSQKSLSRLTMQMRGSKFVKFQEVRIQELSEQVPEGRIPRTLTVHVYGELTRNCSPGNLVSVSGVFVSVDRSGYVTRGNGANIQTFLVAHYIAQISKSSEDDELNIQPMTLDEVQELYRGETNFLSKLTNSIAPEIFGHENIKKSLLLLLVGGVDRNANGMKIRGNINICLMGDPGVAKSQLLSFIDRLASRSQYTTGRGSSGIGLTAAVLKDPVTNEMVLEGGALVLADEGICCIDEFDKMLDADRTAIHEVMEQQTVSIAKAGIMTTLNARTSILAAANPLYGRYNVHRSITDNLQLPPALLSRFDLIWLIRDIASKDKDLELAKHVTDIHRLYMNEIEEDRENIDMKTMRRYISLCKTYQPLVPEDLTEQLVEMYIEIRMRKRVDDGVGKGDSLFTSPRSLLAIIRLSTALARLRLAEVVEKRDVEEAMYLYNCCRESIEGAVSEDVRLMKIVLNALKTLSEGEGVADIPFEHLSKSLDNYGYSRDQLEKVLKLIEEEVETVKYDGQTITMYG